MANTTLLFLSKTGFEFPSVYAVVFYVFNDLRSEVVVRFVDISGIVSPSLFKLFPPHNSSFELYVKLT